MSETTQMRAATEEAVKIVAVPGSRISDDTAQRVYREAQRLPEHERTAENVVDLARDPSSEIHGEFEWNDAIAAEEHRKEQARHLLRSVRVQVKFNDTVIERPAFFSVLVEEDPKQLMAYVRYGTVSDEEAFKTQLIKRARRDLESFKKRYAKHKAIFVDAAPELVEALRIADWVLSQPPAE